MPSSVEILLVLALCLAGGIGIVSIADRALERQAIICQEGC